MFKVFGFTLAVAIISIQAVALFSINLLNPLFMETLLGYDAWKAGLAVAPRGLGVVIALLAVGQLSRRGIDMRPIISGGFMLAAYEVWRMSHWGLGITMSEVLWPIFFFGLGLGSLYTLFQNDNLFSAWTLDLSTRSPWPPPRRWQTSRPRTCSTT